MTHRAGRRVFQMLAALLLLAGWGGGTLPVQAAEPVSVGIVGSISDAPFYIAQAKGFFAAEGLNVTTSNFNSAANMIAPMGTGVKIKIVADKARNSPGYSYSSILVRKSLVTSGKVKSFADFKGLKVAVSGPGITDLSTIDQAMRQGGHTIDDANLVYLGMGQHVAAYANGAIDASLTAEPSTTRILDQGTAVRFASVASFYPNQQTAVVLFSETFMKKRAVAAKFMRAYLQAARYYNSGLKDGHYSGARGDELIDIIAKYSRVKDKALLHRISPNAIDPNGQLDMHSLATDLAFFVHEGWVKNPNLLKQAVDVSFAAAAAKQLGVAGAKP